MDDPYQKAQQLLDAAGAPAGDLAHRVIAVLENQSENHYRELHILTAVVNDCLDRLAASLDFEREYSSDPGYELSETVAGIESVLPDQHARIQRLQQQLAKIQALAAGEDLPADLVSHTTVMPETAKTVIDQLTPVAEEDQVVPVGKASHREAQERPVDEEPLRQGMLSPGDLQEPAAGWSQQ